jgi:hypothetical protein
MLLQVGMTERLDVAKCSVDSEAEHVADTAEVTGAGADLVKDAIFPQFLCAEAEDLVHPFVSRLGNARGDRVIDEYM